MISTRLKYSVEITGHRAPFKWEVNAGNSCPVQREEVGGRVYPRGEANTRWEAEQDAMEAARECEDYRLHHTTKETVYLFTAVDGEMTLDGAFDTLPLTHERDPEVGINSD